MKRISILLLAVVMLLCLTGCRGQSEETENPAGNQTQAAEPEETGETALGNPETEPVSETFTMPPIEMPTKPDADYQLPPGEQPGGDVVSE